MENNEQLLQIMQEMGRRDKADKLERYRRLNKLARPGQILFAGSSLMEQFPIYELLLDRQLPYTIYNRGVGGFTTAEFREALEVCVFELQPRHIFLNIGTNDLNTPEVSLEELMARYEDILTQIRTRLPQTGITLMAYYPMNEEVAGASPWMAGILNTRNNACIGEANRLVAALAEKLGLGFIDCNAPITDDKGNMKAEYTIEGMHMYGNGYAQVLDVLLPLLEKLA